MTASTRLYLAVLLAATAHATWTWILAVRRGRRAAACRVSSEAASVPSPASIVVTAWQERGRIRRCIEALQRLENADWEAIVVAGGPDGTFDLAVQAAEGDDRIRVLRQEPDGKNAALNRGLVAARYDTIVVLDADCEVQPDWLDALTQPLAEGAAACSGEFSARRSTWVTQSEQMANIQARLIVSGNPLQGSGAIAVRRSALEAAGGFPEDVRVGVDWDLALRLERAGVPLAAAPGARLVTDRPATLPEHFVNEVRWRRAHLRLLWRNREWFIQSPARIATALYFYLLSSSLAAAVLACATPWGPALSTRAMALALVVSWLALRRAALAAEVAAYRGDWRWLRLAWAPPLLMLFSEMPSAVFALITAARENAHFKGPRPRIPS